LADYLVAEGVVTDISHEGLRQLLIQENVRFQAVRTWKRSNDPDFEAKRDRIVELDEQAEAGKVVVTCLDDFGPLNLQPQPGGKSWAPRAKPRRIRATLHPPARRQTPDLRLRRRDRQALRAHQETQGPPAVSGVLPLHPHPLST
jgi:hypothetical protein